MRDILSDHFKSFHYSYPFFEMDSLVQFYCIYGGATNAIGLNPFSILEKSVAADFSSHFLALQSNIFPSYLLEEPYLSLLKSISRSDGKLNNVLRRARLGSKLGGELIGQLVKQDILYIENSREQPIRKSPKESIKKSLRGYQIQPKVRFIKPFYRFWYAFVEPYRFNLLKGETAKFIQNFNQHKDKAFYIVFEQLSNAWLREKYASVDPIISEGGFWDYKNEFDILHITTSNKIIIGECKFKSKKVTAKELVKLKHKAKESGIKADKYVLFSRSGFSNELIGLKDKNLILCPLEKLTVLLN